MEVGVIKRCLVAPDDLNICREFENTEHVRNSLRLLGRGDSDLDSRSCLVFLGEPFFFGINSTSPSGMRPVAALKDATNTATNAISVNIMIARIPK